MMNEALQRANDLQKRLEELNLYEEICQHYAGCEISPEALRNWVAERMDEPEQPNIKKIFGIE